MRHKVKYPYIWAEGSLMGSSLYYMQDESEIAKEDGAPSTAVYRRVTDPQRWSKKGSYRWVTIEEIADSSYRERLEQAAANYR